MALIFPVHALRLKVSASKLARACLVTPIERALSRLALTGLEYRRLLPLLEEAGIEACKR